MTRISLLILAPLDGDDLSFISEYFHVTYAPNPEARASVLKNDFSNFRVVLTLGTTGLTNQELALMPDLELVCCLGAGYENLPFFELNKRGILVANGSGTNDDAVADHAMALMLGIVRNIRILDSSCRDGIWRDALAKPPQLSGKKLGIFGLGSIGSKIAKRSLGFDMEIGYHGRQQKKEVAYSFFLSLTEMANWCDILLCATPGGPDTQHRVDRSVMHALGPRGFLVNISRGSVVDTNALAEFLQRNLIAGAALDVYEGEPARPDVLVGLQNVLLTPHMAGFSPEASRASVLQFLENACGHFSGQGLKTPVCIARSDSGFGRK